MSTDRHGMVMVIEKGYGLNSPKIIDVMMKIPREEFTPKRFRDSVYDDRPIDIGYGQTMSQPYTVAEMSKLLTENKNNNQFVKANYQIHKNQKKIVKRGRVLEIGTGSGYQAAVLSYLFDEVYTIEIIPQLAKQAGKVLKKIGFKNIFIKSGSGELGWKEKSPYNAILITAGVEEVPKELLEQLKFGGVLVAPVGKGYDKVMTRLTKQHRFKSSPKDDRSMIAKYKKEKFGIFHFVPFVESTFS
jgi:protein-L-isoaspartate(D-aspartate) O-methyltransferase